MKFQMNNAILLLSGGLDSVVSLALVRNEYNNILALTFDYGQKSFEKEKKSSSDVAKYYKIKHQIINLDWLKDISKSSLNTNTDIPNLNISELDNKDITVKSAKSVWVPNRNGLFINISACYAEALGYNTIIIGANKEEAGTFKDNSLNFINAVNNSIKNSTNIEIKVAAPLINKTKQEIVQLAIEKNIPFNLINSCYNNKKGHCGKCESCLRLKRALEQNKRPDIIKNIFKDNL